MDGDFDYLIKFLILGNSGVGKTSFLNQYTNNVFERKFFPTIGIDFKVKKFIYKIHGKSRRLCLQIWDTAGQERYRSLTTAYYREAMGFIILFDLTNEQSFINIRSWLDQLRIHAYCDTPDIVLCGNKADLNEDRIISRNEAETVAKRYGLPYFETSAATGANVVTSVELLLELVVRRIETATEEALLRSTLSRKLITLADKPEKSKCYC
ncbi:hypothetical protein O3M35_010391 [Rhynocoris fuscipes]|uniref:Ras-related protein Rab-27A n=1 Tax=Rhynocoris fuscipes TaxID=488301 RepID=A0AAW1D4W1_9HEMI